MSEAVPTQPGGLKVPEGVNPIIIIGVDAQGKISVTAPIENKVFCIDILLEAAKIINRHEPSKIIKP